jgi:hypothetical protein
MKTLFLRLCHTMTAALHARLDLALEIMELRHQLAVLKRSRKQPHSSPADRYLWVLFSTVWARWTGALEIGHAITVRRWRRQGVRQLL